MIEYSILYTIDGEGYSPGRPWIWSYADTKEQAAKELAEALEYLGRSYSKYEAWPEAREIGPWKRVDLSAGD